MQRNTSPRKIPINTHIHFTTAALKEAARVVQALGLPQVEFSSTADRGFHALIYGKSGRICLRSCYCFNHREQRISLGELGYITLEQARQKHLAIRSKASQGIDPKAPPNVEITFAELHFKHYIQKGIASQKKSLHTDESRYTHCLGPAFGHLPLSQITVTAVNNLIIKMREDGKKPATIQKTISQLSSMLNLAVDLDLLPKNIVKAVKLPRVNNQRTEYLTVEQLQKFIAAARARPELTPSRLLMLLGLTGARLGEGLAAKWDDIDLAAGIWKLPTQKSGKSGVIHLSEATKGVLLEMAMIKRNEFVFPGERDNEQLSRPIKVFKKICKDAGIPDGFRIHDLRHGWISVALNAGVYPEIVRQAARHASFSTTGIYSHAYRESLVAANETVANLIGQEKAAA